MKTIVMLRNSVSPNYESRMYLQKQTLEKAGYNVYQFFIRYEKGLKIWCLHGDKTEQWTLDGVSEVGSQFLRCCGLFKPAVVLRNILSMHMLYKTVKHFVKEDIDVVHAVNLDIMPLAVKLKKKYKCKIVYDLLEMYAFMVSPKPGSAVEGYYLRKDKRMWKHVDYVFTMTDITYKWMSYLLFVLTKNKCPPIVTVANSKLLQYERYREPSRDRPFILLYLGTIAKSRFLKETIEVVETFGGKINFIIGGIPQTSLYYKEVVAMCKKYKHSQFIGQIPHTEVIPMTRGCDAVLCMIDPKQRNSARALANKQHEAMVTGRPIITTQGTHPGNMTLKNNCGYVIKYNKYWLHFALKAFFKYPQLSKVFGQNALQMAKNKYNWSFDAARMLAAYKELMS